MFKAWLYLCKTFKMCLFVFFICVKYEILIHHTEENKMSSQIPQNSKQEQEIFLLKPVELFTHLHC